MKAWSREFTLEFIDLLYSQTYMWDMSNPEYRLSESRKRGYELLTEKAREIDPTATVEGVKRKIKGLRTNLKKMERRVNAYRNCGLEHKPSLFYYEPLSFLLTQDRNAYIQRRKQEAAEDKDESRADSSDASMEEEAAQEEREAQVRMRSNEIMDCDVFGQYVAAKLITIAKLQRVYLEKIINDAIFQAELGNLSPTTRLYKEEHFSNSEHTFIVDLSSSNAPQRIPNDVVVMEEVQEDSRHDLDESSQEIEADPFSQIDSRGYSPNGSELHIQDEAGSIIKVENVDVIESWREGENHIVAEAGPSHSEALEPKQNKPIILTNCIIENGIAMPQDASTNRETFIKVQQYNGADGSPVINNMVSLKNVEFADDDLLKMCEDDGITIICVEEESSSSK